MAFVRWTGIQILATKTFRLIGTVVLRNRREGYYFKQNHRVFVDRCSGGVTLPSRRRRHCPLFSCPLLLRLLLLLLLLIVPLPVPPPPPSPPPFALAAVVPVPVVVVVDGFAICLL